MAIVNPFKGVRPVRDKVSLVASRSYLSYSKETLIEKLENNPYTFLHIINPDFSNKQKAKNLKHKFQMVKDKFKSFVHKGVFIKIKKTVFTSTNKLTEITITLVLSAPPVFKIT